MKAFVFSDMLVPELPPADPQLQVGEDMQELISQPLMAPPLMAPPKWSHSQSLTLILHEEEDPQP